MLYGRVPSHIPHEVSDESVHFAVTATDEIVFSWTCRVFMDQIHGRSTYCRCRTKIYRCLYKIQIWDFMLCMSYIIYILALYKEMMHTFLKHSIVRYSNMHSPPSLCLAHGFDTFLRLVSGTNNILYHC